VSASRAIVPAVALAAALAGCVRFHAGTIGDDVPGDAVRETIDRDIGAPVAAAKPGLGIGKAVCPEHLDLSNGKRGRCTIPIHGAAIPIAVTSGPGFGRFTVASEASAFVMKDVERYLHGEMLREYGVESTVRCDGPAVRVLAPGAEVRCAIAGPGVRERSIAFKVVDTSGRIFVYRLKTMHGAMDAFAPYLSAHKAGRTTVVPGSLIAALIRRFSLSGAKFAGSDAALVGAASCPPAVDLTDGRIGRCTLSVQKKPLHYQAWIEEPNGITVRPMEAVISTKRVGETAAAGFTAKLRAAGLPDTMAVDCGPDRLMILEPQSTFTCTTHTFPEGVTRTMTATVQDVEGHVRFTVVPKG
jgi:hypothetical protein